MTSLWLLLIAYISGKTVGNLTLYEKDQYIFWTTLVSWLSLLSLTTTHYLLFIPSILSIISWKTALLITPLLAVFTPSSFLLVLAGLATGIINTWLDIVKDEYLAFSLFSALLLSFFV